MFERDTLLLDADTFGIAMLSCIAKGWPALTRPGDGVHGLIHPLKGVA